jgi:hypothetical protein
MDRSFRVFFRRKQQFYDVYLHNTTPTTFNRRGGGRWGYFVPRWENPKVGLFGEIHLVQSRVRYDSVQHELDHLRCAWIFGNRVNLSTRNEEWFCRFGDELIRNFYREYKKIGEK